jgi:tyrosyl-tRNA synthetase
MLFDDLVFRGIVHQLSDEGLPGRLDTERLTFYIGFDATNPSLHIGSLLQLTVLRRLQLAGHRPIALAGGGTAMVGDPGGKNAERELLTRERLEANLAGITPQIATFVDLSDGLVLDNSEWLLKLGAIEFLREVGKHVTVNEMTGKESVRARLARPDQGISYAEFSYMLLQAYDYLRLHLDHGCELQIGGSDQWGNITVGVELVRKVAHAAVYGMTTPLVTKADGTKFGKTEEGAVWLDPRLTSPYRFYQFLVQTEDTAVGQYLRYFTFLPREEIEALDAATAAHPERRDAQRALAREVTTRVHGEKEMLAAERAAAALFGESIAELDEATLLDVVGEAPSSTIPRAHVVDGGVPLVDAMVAGGLVSSKADARRTISQGGAYVNNRRVDDPGRVLSAADLLHGRYVVVRRGRRDYHLVVAE